MIITLCLFNVLIFKNYFVFNAIVFNIKYKYDYEKACLSLDFVQKQFTLKLPV
jgi:hypothetical protein